MTTDALLEGMLQVTVPMWIAELRTYREEDRLAIGRRDGDFVAEHGDDVLYRGHKRGDSAKAFTAVARGLAVLAFQPGGVTAFGGHWCTDHEVCESADAKARAQLAAEPPWEPPQPTYKGRPVTTIASPVQAELFGGEAS
ncbi:MAG: hypothetical protein J2P30_01695 [Actinobacteria bacterium]|nr:hypothetical protein [Actinomycetota bacterium]